MVCDGMYACMYVCMYEVGHGLLMALSLSRGMGTSVRPFPVDPLFPSTVAERNKQEVWVTNPLGKYPLPHLTRDFLLAQLEIGRSFPLLEASLATTDDDAEPRNMIVHFT